MVTLQVIQILNGRITIGWERRDVDFYELVSVVRELHVDYPDCILNIAISPVPDPMRQWDRDDLSADGPM